MPAQLQYKPENGIIKLRDINASEELCWDYSTSIMERHCTMHVNVVKGYP
jgi:SET domain-containing protein